MDVSIAFNIVIGIVCSLMGWILRVVWETQTRLRQDLNEMSLRLGSEYVTKEDHRYMTDGIMSRFDRLESRLEHYFNMRGPH